MNARARVRICCWLEWLLVAFVLSAMLQMFAAVFGYLMMIL